MLDKAIALYSGVKEAHQETYLTMKEIKDDLQKGLPSVKDLADLVYATKQCKNLVEDSVRDLRSLIELSEKLTCLLWTRLGDPNPIRTEHCTATPRVGQMASLPKRKSNPEGFKKLMEYFKVPPALWDLPDGERGPVEFDWKGVTELITSRAEQGLPLPPGIDPQKTYPVYGVTCKPRKEVDARDEGSISDDSDNPF